MKNSLKISTIIVVKNSPLYLEKSINSVYELSDEIILVDIGLTKKINLKKYKKINIVKIQKDVPYVELLREETKKYAKNNWLIFLDPDEIFTQELKKIIKNNIDKVDYFSIPRKNIIFNQWIRHSRWWPDYQVRVFKKDKVFWPKTLHSQPETKGEEFLVEPKEQFSIIHYNYENIDQYFEKARRYAKSEASFLIKNNLQLTFEQTIKKSLSEFISRYFAFKGYLDGLVGFTLAFFQMIYYFLVYFYYLEQKQFKHNEEIKPEVFFKKGLKETLHWKNNKTLKEKLIKKIL